MVKISWNIIDECRANGTYQGWNVTRHAMRIPWDTDKYLYVATKDGNRIVSQELEDIKTESLKFTQVKLL